MNDDKPSRNTDRHLWREREDDDFSPSVHVTASGAIGINCGGSVFVMPLRAWHKLATDAAGPLPKMGRLPPAPPKLSVVPEEQPRILDEREVRALAKRAGLPKYMDDTEAARMALARFAHEVRRDMNNGGQS